MFTRILFMFTFLCLVINLNAKKNKVSIKGEIESRINYFINDSSFFEKEDYEKGNVPKQYTNKDFKDNLSNETWINLNGRYKNFSFFSRYDIFYNSNLRNPNGSFTSNGLGAINLSYFHKFFEIELGSIYTQLGNGTAIRTFEERDLQIDNALLGVKLKLKPLKSLQINFLGGFLKDDPTASSDVAGIFKPISPYFAPIYGMGAEHNFFNKQFSILNGFSFLFRKLKDSNFDQIKSFVLLDGKKQQLQRQTSVINYYNKININSFSISSDFGYKTKENAFEYNNGIRNLSYSNKSGYSYFLSLDYYGDKISGILRVRKLDFFEFRVSPTLEQNNGFISYFAPLSKVNTRRLTGRYVPNVQFQDEVGYWLEVFYKNKKLKLNYNLSDIRNSENVQVFLEHNIESEYKFSKNFKTKQGFQYIKYNQLINQAEGDMVIAYTPFVDLIWKIKRGTTILSEISVMDTQQDLGSWFWANVELQHKSFSFSGGDMYNYGNEKEDRKIHYVSFNTSYSYKKIRLNVAYTKQPQTVVCNGGVCRIEPAFNGIKANFKLNF